MILQQFYKEKIVKSASNFGDHNIRVQIFFFIYTLNSNNPLIVKRIELFNQTMMKWVFVSEVKKSREFELQMTFRMIGGSNQWTGFHIFQPRLKASFPIMLKNFRMNEFHHRQMHMGWL